MSKYILAAKVVCGVIFLSSCTISFQNIHTNGPTKDLVDDNFTNSPDVETELDIPAI